VGAEAADMHHSVWVYYLIQQHVPWLKNLYYVK